MKRRYWLRRAAALLAAVTIAYLAASLLAVVSIAYGLARRGRVGPWRCRATGAGRRARVTGGAGARTTRACSDRGR